MFWKKEKEPIKKIIEKDELDEFRKKIKGIFDDWKIDGSCCTAKKGDYEIWIANQFNSFADYTSKSKFLEVFTEEEKVFLWAEVQSIRKDVIKQRDDEKRKKIFKEFKLYKQEPKAKPKKKKE